MALSLDDRLAKTEALLVGGRYADFAEAVRTARAIIRATAQRTVLERARVVLADTLPSFHENTADVVQTMDDENADPLYRVAAALIIIKKAGVPL